MTADIVAVPSIPAPAPHLPTPLLDVRGLRIDTDRADGPQTLVHGIDLRVAAGQTLGIVGESGSGKTLTALAVAGLLPRGVVVAGGQVELAGQSLLDLSPPDRRRVLADQLGVIFQNPALSLNPRLTIGAQIREALPLALRRSRRQSRVRALELLNQVGVSRPTSRLSAFPHELSGGLNQRIVIAIAIARNPSLLIADEPTTALDVSVQAQVLDLIDQLRAELGLGVILVSHDIGLVADRADTIVVMHNGLVVETGYTADVLEFPTQVYTRQLIAAAPRLDAPSPPGPARKTDAFVVATGVRKVFERTALTAGRRHTLVAVEHADVALTPGQTLGIVGESGSGKTTLARILVGLEIPTSGEVRYHGRLTTELARSERRDWRRQIQYVFQDPYGALDPRLTVRQIIAEPIELSGTGPEKAAAGARVRQLLAEVELTEEFADRRPGQLSGGQRQRVVIARALALDPQVVIADEPVSALDLTVQATILELLLRLQQQRGLTIVVISHDLAVIKSLCHDVIVMRAGHIVERGTTDEIFTNPQHAYTRQLLDAIPGRGDPRAARDDESADAAEIFDPATESRPF